MSVKEKMVHIQSLKKAEIEAEEERVRAAQIEERDRALEHADRYERELPQARRKQGLLFDELREEGIISMIEEVAEQPIVFDQVKSTEFPPRWKTPEEFEAARKAKWAVSLPHPVLTRDTLEWNTDLVIHLETEVNKGMIPNISGRGHRRFDTVEVIYGIEKGSPLKKLLIQGAETTFKGQIPADQAGKSLLVEYALAHAFLEPARRESNHSISRIVVPRPTRY
jgi:hypothetical protein